MITLTVDGTPLSVPDGASVLDAVLRLDGALPHLCREPNAPPQGACRTCLVAIDGARRWPAACVTPARDGMVVRTDDPEVERTRRAVLELTLAMQPAHGPVANFLRDDELHTAATQYGLTAPRFARAPKRALDESNPFFSLNHADCILCNRCVQACEDIQHIGAITMVGHGRETRVGAFAMQPIGESVCTSCGQCVATCPTGALLPKAAISAEQHRTRTTCPYCGVGCGITLRTGGGRIEMVDDEPENRSSMGMLCVKGRFGTTFANSPDRLTRPLVRRDGSLVPASWDEALDAAAEGLARKLGGFGAFASAKCTNEDGYVIQKFVRTVMGTNNIDHCTRLCHSPSVEAMLQQLGSGATSNSYEDYENAGCLVVIGCDPSSNHPVVASRIRRAIDERGVRLIVVNPRRIDLCDRTDLWLRPLPGTDVALFNAIAKVIYDEGLHDRDFIASRTENFEEWEAVIRGLVLDEQAAVCGVPLEKIREAARLYARPPLSGGSCLIWGMGITQHSHGTDNARSLLNLALLAGQVGRPGNGVSPLRGQNNVQGCGDAGCIPDSLPGYVGLGEAARARAAAAWGVEPPAEPGLKATDMIEGILHGGIRAMYVTGENPLLSEPNLEHATEAMKALDFLVVQDIFLHETAEIADVVLPAASFAEKEGTFTNSERRVQRVRKALNPPGEARTDWEITCDLARRVGARLGRPASGFDFASAAEIFDEMARITPQLGGLSHERLDREGGIQWPCPTPDHPGTPRLYEAAFPRGRGRFAPVRQQEPAAEMPDGRYPFMLNTGRILYHWHGGTITRRVKGLMERAPFVPLAIHPDDATRLGIVEGDEVVLYSRRGEMEARAAITDAVRAGELFVPFARLGEHSANFLTNNVYDADSRIPEYKACAVRIVRKADVGKWRRERGKPKAAAGPV